MVDNQCIRRTKRLQVLKLLFELLRNFDLIHPSITKPITRNDAPIRFSNFHQRKNTPEIKILKLCLDNEARKLAKPFV